MFYVSESNPFQPFGTIHIITLLICLLAIWFAFQWSKKITTEARWKKVRITMVLWMIFLESSWFFFRLVHGRLQLKYDLPLELCTVSLWLCVVMLITQSKFIYRIVVFTGLVGATIALLTPELFYNFPHLRYFHFFMQHTAILISILLMKHVEKPVLRYPHVWYALAFLNGHLVLCYIVNSLTGANYFFVMGKPENPSLLDYLGPYPYYLIACELVALMLFHFVYLLVEWKKVGDRKVRQIRKMLCLKLSRSKLEKDS